MDTTKFDLVKTDGELAMAVIAEFPENTDMAGSPLEKGLILGRDGVARDPARYANIMMLALNNAPTDERRASFGLEVVNGLRRRNGHWHPKDVTDNLDTAMQAIDRLPTDHPRKNRLLGLANYNGGILYRNTGAYTRSRSFQMAAAAMELAAGNPQKAAISLFCAQVEAVSEYCASGIRLNTLYKMGRALEPVMDADWMDNVAIHLLEFYFLADEMPLDMEWLLGHLDPKKTDFWPDIINGVMLPCLRKDWQTVLANADDLRARMATIASSSTQKAVYACLLAKARALRATGYEKEAHELTSQRTIDDNRFAHGGSDYRTVIEMEFGTH